MKTFSNLKNAIIDKILVITINRPESLNALNNELIAELSECFQEACQDTAIGGIILTGSGEKAFVAGADIKELSAVSRQNALEMSRKGQILFGSIEKCPKPVIAAVNGFALGGGCEIAMACHIRIASKNARFGQPEVNLGTIPGYGGTQRLTQLVGRGKALELMLTGDMISAEEAHVVGLVNQLADDQEKLMEQATAMMKKILSKGPLAVANVIRSVNAGFSFEDAGYTAEAERFAECADTQDFKEGTAAFLEKRKPVFKGA